MGRYKQGETPNNIFRYDDYRKFLKDYFEEQKKIRKVFTQRFFAQKAGFNSHSFCPLVIKGKRKLTAESKEKIICAIPLKADAAEYFRILVKYNHAATAEEKQEYFNRLNVLREKTKFSRLDKIAYPFFDKWYYPVVRAVAAYSDWGGDFRKLAKMVLPPISVEQARAAVEALVGAGMLIPEGASQYRVHANKLTTEDIPSIVRNKNRRELLQQCIYNTELLPPEKRYLAYSTLATSEKTFKKIQEYLDSVRKNVIDMVMADENNEVVYELVFNVVPFSEKYQNVNSESENVV